METNNSYTINRTVTSILLNDNLTNFKITFTVASRVHPFQLCIVNSSMLDSISQDQLEFKNIENIVSGDIEYDKNIYDSYYMLLKSDFPTMVDVNLIKDVLEPQSSNNVNMNSNTILIVIVVLVILALLYYMIKNNKIGTSDITNLLNSATNGNNLQPSITKKSLLERFKNLPIQ